MSLRSSPVSTSTTPGIAFARETSIETISAWACGERRIAACSVPVRVGKWSENIALPVSSAASSTRSTGCPTYFSWVWLIVSFFLPRPSRRRPPPLRRSGIAPVRRLCGTAPDPPGVRISRTEDDTDPVAINTILRCGVKPRGPVRRDLPDRAQRPNMRAKRAGAGGTREGQHRAHRRELDTVEARLFPTSSTPRSPSSTGTSTREGATRPRSGPSTAKPAIASSRTQVARTGNALLGEGIEPGDRVLMVVKDCPEFVFCFFGAVRAGIVPVPGNTMMRPQDYKFLIQDFGLPGRGLQRGMGGGGGGRAGRRRREAADGAPDRRGRAGCGRRRRRHPTCWRRLRPRRWTTVSGSIPRVPPGTPKGLSTITATWSAPASATAGRSPGLREDDTVFSVSKLFHSYGFGNAMTFPLWVGATIGLSDRRPTPQMTFEAIEALRPTVFFACPPCTPSSSRRWRRRTRICRRSGSASRPARRCRATFMLRWKGKRPER